MRGQAAAGPPPAYGGRVPEIISEPVRIPVPGGKVIEEFVGRVASGDGGVSVARMAAPAGWSEPGQAPEFDEVTLVLARLRAGRAPRGGVEVRAGQAVITRAGEWVRYSAGPERRRLRGRVRPRLRPRGGATGTT